MNMNFKNVIVCTLMILQTGCGIFPTSAEGVSKWNFSDYEAESRAEGRDPYGFIPKFSVRADAPGSATVRGNSYELKARLVLGSPQRCDETITTYTVRGQARPRSRYQLDPVPNPLIHRAEIILDSGSFNCRGQSPYQGYTGFASCSVSVQFDDAIPERWPAAMRWSSRNSLDLLNDEMFMIRVSSAKRFQVGVMIDGAREESFFTYDLRGISNATRTWADGAERENSKIKPDQIREIFATQSSNWHCPTETVALD